MNIHKILGILIKPFRKNRMLKFLNIMNPQPTDTILDVGGTAFNWELVDYKNKVVLLNLTKEDDQGRADNFSFVIGDGTALEYADNEFDIVFSNSVIEHVGSFEKQQAYGREVMRVGKRIWIQTPAKSFFFEPHLITPFVHWLPKELQKKLLRNFSVWGWITRPDQQYINDFVDQTRLVSFEEVKEIFPGCQILRERFLFMTKAFIVIK